MAARPEMSVEAWLSGPIAGVPPLLMPAAHAFTQASIDIERAADLPPDALWATPGGAASVGFHLQHLAGSTDRLLTYARGEKLTTAQREALAAEGRREDVSAAALVRRAQAAFAAAIDQIRATPVDSLTDARQVGRAALPSSVAGLVFHAAEHASRHVGQLVTTVKVIRAG